MHKIIFYGVFIMLVLSFAFAIFENAKRNKDTSYLCKEMGYKIGNWSLIGGNECLEEKCVIINNIESCKSHWISMGTLTKKEGKKE